MPWLVADLLIGLLAFLLLVGVCLLVFRKSKGLLRTAKAASARVSDVTDAFPRR